MKDVVEALPDLVELNPAELDPVAGGFALAINDIIITNFFNNTDNFHSINFHWLNVHTVNSLIHGWFSI